MFHIRLIREDDITSVLDIYSYYVQNTIISFEYDVPSIEDFSKRIADTVQEFPWLVCLQDNKVIGYAYAHKHRFRSAYQWSPESTVYIAPDFHARGIGRLLYNTLFALLKLQGYFNVFAGVGLPNEKSVGFHKATGFEEIGIFKKIGYKHGNWHDTQWFQLQLSEHLIDPPPPRTIDDIKGSETFTRIILEANRQLETLISQG